MAAVTEHCKGCGAEVVTMTYRGTGFCGGRCTDAAPKVEPARGDGEPCGCGRVGGCRVGHPGEPVNEPESVDVETQVVS